MRQLLAGAPGARLVGKVEDVRPHLHQAAALVVPLRIGGGTRIKILEAMAAGTPVVATSVGAEGIAAAHGVYLLLADTPGGLCGSRGSGAARAGRVHGSAGACSRGGAV